MSLPVAVASQAIRPALPAVIPKETPRKVAPGKHAWQLRCDNETESIGTLLEVNPPASPPLAYWHLFILPPLGVLGFLLNQKARLRPQKKAKRI